MTAPGKPTRAREMTAADKRRVNLVDVIHDQGITVREPDPARDQWGNVLPVIVEDDHRSLLHNDGKGEPRPPVAWEDRRASERAASFAKERSAMTAQLKRDRARMPVSEQLAMLLREITRLQTVKAQQRRETDAKGAVDGSLVPSTEGAGAIAHADPFELEQRLKIIALQIEACWELLDEHHGRGHRSYPLMAIEDKDALLVGAKFRDLSPLQVAALHEQFGTLKHIGYVRRLAGLDDYGNKREQAA